MFPPPLCGRGGPFPNPRRKAGLIQTGPYRRFSPQIGIYALKTWVKRVYGIRTRVGAKKK